MSEPVTGAKPVSPTQLFHNKSGSMSQLLRLETGESLEQGLTRLKARGWDIPAAIEQGEDEVSKFIKIKE